jgi:hypothetical protein
VARILEIVRLAWRSFRGNGQADQLSWHWAERRSAPGFIEPNRMRPQRSIRRRRRCRKGPPGTIIRSEVIDDFYPGATANPGSTSRPGYDGAPTAVSGIIVVHDGPAPATGRKVIAWTHGTVCVAPACSPSLVPNYAAAMPGIEEFMEAGYVIAATDYQGLGTPGPQPYLVGDSEGMGALTAARRPELDPQ